MPRELSDGIVDDCRSFPPRNSRHEAKAMQAMQQWLLRSGYELVPPQRQASDQEAPAADLSQNGYG
eukprot:12279225-Prorocentrum_lima.AAC.1